MDEPEEVFKYNAPDDLKFWAAETGDVVVKVRVTYQEVVDEGDDGITDKEAAEEES